jgi:hypothetical protein
MTRFVREQDWREMELGHGQVISTALTEAEDQEQTRPAAEGYRFYADEALEFAGAIVGVLSCREYSEEIYSETSLQRQEDCDARAGDGQNRITDHPQTDIALSHP